MFAFISINLELKWMWVNFAYFCCKFESNLIAFREITGLLVCWFADCCSSDNCEIAHVYMAALSTHTRYLFTLNQQICRAQYQPRGARSDFSTIPNFAQKPTAQKPSIGTQCTRLGWFMFVDYDDDANAIGKLLN